MACSFDDDCRCHIVLIHPRIDIAYWSPGGEFSVARVMRNYEKTSMTPCTVIIKDFREETLITVE
jgi:hypothetical protein